MTFSSWLVPASVCGLLIIAACSAGSSDNVPSGGGAAAGTSGGNGDSGSGNGNGGNEGDAFVRPDDEGGVICEPESEYVDNDLDGWSVSEGDCNDCNPSINPGAFDDPNDGIDNNCDGIVDNPIALCDSDLDIDDADAMKGARAIELCRVGNPTPEWPEWPWGVISAKYVKADGTVGMKAIQRGLLPSFGATSVQRGQRMLALSTGTARATDQPGWLSPVAVEHGTESNPPQGYPKEAPACPGVNTKPIALDPAALEIEIMVPTNANSFSFDFNFFTYEFPHFICSEFNDFFVTLLWPRPNGLPDENISFDSLGNPISVNNSLLQVCVPQETGGKWYECPLGPGSLNGTGFDEHNEQYYQYRGPHAATGWLVTKAPIQPRSTIKLRFAIWDSGDYWLDSTVLIDNFTWGVETVKDVGTTPAPPR